MSLSRRPHNKSRAGCSYCKQRRVKCDEARPQCGACKRRQFTCVYVEPPRVNGSRLLRTVRGGRVSEQPIPTTTTSAPGAGLLPITPQWTDTSSPASDEVGRIGIGCEEPSFDFFDLRLLSHFHAEVSASLQESGVRPSFVWDEQVPNAVFDNSANVYALLALSALHLARGNQKHRSKSLARAQHHHAKALPLMAKSLELLSLETANSLFMGATLLCLCTLAMGPQPGKYLAFGDSDDAEFVWLIKGVRSIISKHTPSALHNFLQGHQHELNNPAQFENASSEPFSIHLHKLRDFAAAMTAEEPDFAKYISAIDQLDACSRRSPSPSDQHHHQHPQEPSPTIPSYQILRWLYTISPDYAASLRAKRPLALVIFAFFDVLLFQLQHLWYFEGWPQHIMCGIEQALHPSYRHWLEWPMSAIGWSEGDSLSPEDPGR